jgi:hypothetical protein
LGDGKLPGPGCGKVTPSTVTALPTQTGISARLDGQSVLFFFFQEDVMKFFRGPPRTVETGTYQIHRPLSPENAVEVVRGSNGATFVLVDKSAAREALNKAGRSVFSTPPHSHAKSHAK